MGRPFFSVRTFSGHRSRREVPVFQSGRPDLNRGPLVPQTSALTRLRYAPWGDTIPLPVQFDLRQNAPTQSIRSSGSSIPRSVRKSSVAARAPGTE